eukprot:scaffold105460_cov35-Prasinocladus_malaysianus.AAC.1
MSPAPSMSGSLFALRDGFHREPSLIAARLAAPITPPMSCRPVWTASSRQRLPNAARPDSSLE